MTELELRGLLGCFLFSGDDADKKIKILSGGEKARVALAKTIVSKANFLMLDEPTNHLDMHSCDLLIDALKKYQGSIILVSHDRYFISKTANKIWEIVDHEIKEFKGGYEEWVEWKERMAANERSNGKQDLKNRNKSQEKPKESPAPPVQPANTSANNSSTTTAVLDKTVARKELQKFQKQFQQVEKKVEEIKTQKLELENRLSHPDAYSNAEELKKTEAAYKQATIKLDEMNAQYEELFEKIMKLEEDLAS